MACFTVPLAGAAAVAAAKGCLGEKARRNGFLARLGMLCAMSFGGSLLLAVEHIYHGEISFAPPFLTAIEEGPAAVEGMLREMATRGTAMAALIVAAWALWAAVDIKLEKKRNAAACAN